MASKTMTSLTSEIVSPVPSALDANTLHLTVNKLKMRSSSITIIDYTSIMGLEDRKRRFSNNVPDMELRDRERLKKLYRQIQKQVQCRQDRKRNSTRWSWPGSKNGPIAWR